MEFHIDNRPWILKVLIAPTTARAAALLIVLLVLSDILICFNSLLNPFSEFSKCRANFDNEDCTISSLSDP